MMPLFVNQWMFADLRQVVPAKPIFTCSYNRKYPLAVCARYFRSNRVKAVTEDKETSTNSTRVRRLIKGQCTCFMHRSRVV